MLVEILLMDIEVSVISTSVDLVSVGQVFNKWNIVVYGSVTKADSHRFYSLLEYSQIYGWEGGSTPQAPRL